MWAQNVIEMWTALLGSPGLGLARLARLAALPGLGLEPERSNGFRQG